MSITRWAIGRSLMTMSVLSAMVSMARAQGSRTVFDLLEVDAIAQALEAKGLRDKAKPGPRNEFEQIIQTRPDYLASSDAGKTWRIRPYGKDEEEILTTPALNTEDFAFAVRLLQLPYVKEYVQCMKKAARGKGTEDCLKTLVGLARETGEGKEVLLAGLQARVFSYAARNPEWRNLAFGNNRPVFMEEIAQAYSKLELEKLVASKNYNIAGMPTDGGVSFHTAGIFTTGGDISYDWMDFNRIHLTSDSFKTKKTGTKVLGWRVDSDGKLVNVDPDKEFGSTMVYTFEVAPDRQIICSGKLTKEMVRSLRMQDNVEDFLKVTGSTEDTGVKVFLSRPGSNVVGILSKGMK